MRRFFIDPGAIGSGTALITGELFRHLVTVLRMKVGYRLTLVDGLRGEFDGVITAIRDGEVEVKIEADRSVSPAGTDMAMTLLQGVPKGERMELILQKGTELGAARFIPVLTSRSVPRLSGDKATERRRRWERIVHEAARQSRRSDIPEVGEIVTLATALAAADQEVKLLLWEGENERGLQEVLDMMPCPASVALLIGPEGGLSHEEAQEAMAAGFVPVTLGPRILRTETAGLAVLSILQFVWGDVG